tara:strand:- start:81 stop:413 length:333 start_codon:yes stop_codon:yes gene_type:complete
MEEETITKCMGDINYIRNNYKECCPVTVGPTEKNELNKNCGIVTREKMEKEQEQLETMANMGEERVIESECSVCQGNVENGILLFILFVLLFVMFRKDIKKIKFLKRFFK